MMMNTEQEPDRKDPIYEESDIPSLAAAITLYVTAFSKEPFNEKWKVIEGELNPEDPEDLNNFVTEILHNPSELIIEPDDNDKQTTYFKETVIKTFYPLNKIIVPYVEALNNPDALLILKGDSNDIYKLSEGERINQHTTPRAVARFVNYSAEKIHKLSEEIGEYLNNKDFEEVIRGLEDGKKTVYLGEIVNLNDNLIQQGSFTRQTLEIYKNKYEKNLPDRVIYLTKPGTGVERNDKREHLNNKFMTALIEKSYPKGTKFEHNKLTFTNSPEETILIYISKIDETS